MALKTQWKDWLLFLSLIVVAITATAVLMIRFPPIERFLTSFYVGAINPFVPR